MFCYKIDGVNKQQCYLLIIVLRRPTNPFTGIDYEPAFGDLNGCHMA